MSGPHQDQPVETAGAPIDAAEAGVVLVHGRGSSAGSFLQFATSLDAHGVTFVAPQAQRGSWYPNRFVAELEANEPHLSSALQAVDDAVEKLRDAGLPLDRIALVGFSQGACLASEYVARNPRRYGGLAALSGGLIGPPGHEFDHAGDLEGTPVFLGCSDDDPHIPEERVHESRDAFERLNGDVTERIYDGVGHTIVDDEVEYLEALLAGLTADG